MDLSRQKMHSNVFIAFCTSCAYMCTLTTIFFSVKMLTWFVLGNCDGFGVNWRKDLKNDAGFAEISLEIFCHHCGPNEKSKCGTYRILDEVFKNLLSFYPLLISIYSPLLTLLLFSSLPSTVTLYPIQIMPLSHTENGIFLIHLSCVLEGVQRGSEQRFSLQLWGTEYLNLHSKIFQLLFYHLIA